MITKILQHPCLFLKYTGLYCPGCGGTRAVKELLNGHILKSLWYHPIVIYIIVLAGWYVLSCAIEAATRGHIKTGMHFQNKYLYLGLAVVVINWITRNVLLIFWGITL